MACITHILHEHTRYCYVTPCYEEHTTWIFYYCVRCFFRFFVSYEGFFAVSRWNVCSGALPLAVHNVRYRHSILLHGRLYRRKVHPPRFVAQTGFVRLGSCHSCHSTRDYQNESMSKLEAAQSKNKTIDRKVIRSY